MINIVNMPRAYSEVYAFLEVCGDKYKNKLPKKIYDVIKENRDINYNPTYAENQTINKNDISKEALSLIAALNLQYWCEDEGEKLRLKKIYIENGKKEQEKYSYDNIFKNNNEVIEKLNDKEEIQLVNYKKQRWYEKLFAKILKIFKKN